MTIAEVNAEEPTVTVMLFEPVDTVPLLSPTGKFTSVTRMVPGDIVALKPRVSMKVTHQEFAVLTVSVPAKVAVLDAVAVLELSGCAV
jgi:hypothetical protein